MTRRRLAQLTAATVVIGALALVTLARRQRATPGHTQPAPQCGLVGTWNTPRGISVDVSADGKWRLHNGDKTALGTWKAEGNRLMLTDSSMQGAGTICPANQVGTYAMQIAAEPCTLKLELVDDPCAARGRVLKKLGMSKSLPNTPKEDHARIATTASKGSG